MRYHVPPPWLPRPNPPRHDGLLNMAAAVLLAACGSYVLILALGTIARLLGHGGAVYLP